MIWLWIWGIVTALALMMEFLKSDLITVWFAAGGLITLLIVALAPEMGIIWQFVIFVTVSSVLLFSTRKICLKLLNSEPQSDAISPNTKTIDDNKKIADKDNTDN